MKISFAACIVPTCVSKISAWAAGPEYLQEMATFPASQAPFRKPEGKIPPMDTCQALRTLQQAPTTHDSLDTIRAVNARPSIQTPTPHVRQHRPRIVKGFDEELVVPALFR